MLAGMPNPTVKTDGQIPLLNEIVKLGHQIRPSNQTVKSDRQIRQSDRPCRVYVRMWVEFKDSLMFLGGVAKVPPCPPNPTDSFYRALQTSVRFRRLALPFLAFPFCLFIG